VVLSNFYDQQNKLFMFSFVIAVMVSFPKFNKAKKENIFGPSKAKWIGRSDRIGDPENLSGSECGIRFNFSKGSGSGMRSKKIGSV
jgi:hypothetical protein